jgi:hypothetical protein
MVKGAGAYLKKMEIELRIRGHMKDETGVMGGRRGVDGQ